MFIVCLIVVYAVVERLTVTYSRSSGPGGQHVNKGEYSVKECPEGSAGFWVQDFHPTLTVNTKAEVRFHVLTADWIPEDIRLKVIEKVCLQVWFPLHTFWFI